MKPLLAFSILAILLSSSCKSADKFTQFDLPYQAETTIPAALGINLPFDLPTPAIKSNIEQSYEVNNTRKSLIEEVSLKTLKLSIDEDDFDFLKKIKVFINAEGLNEIEIASKMEILDNQQILELDLNLDVNLMEYINKDQFTLKVARY